MVLAKAKENPLTELPLRKGVFCAFRPAKASPFGRGVTEGDGEGKPVTKRLLTQRWAGSLSERCYRNMAASLSASLPSQALRASSPKGRAFAEGKLHILLSPITHPMMNIGINLL